MALLLLQAFPFAERIDYLDVLSHALVENTRIDVITPCEKQCKLLDFNAIDDYLRGVGRQVGLLLSPASLVVRVSHRKRELG